MTRRGPDEHVANAADRLLRWYVRGVGGGDWPFLVVERRYLRAWIAPGSAVADIGGGDGRLANDLAPTARHVFIVDRETTSLPGADASQYAGALSRAMAGRASPNISAILGDATSLPFAAESLDAVVSSQMLEHVAEGVRPRFFSECARVLKPRGLLALSTPNGDYLATHAFRFAALARRLVPRRWIVRLPRSMRGPWLERDVASWEVSVGHYDHGCRLARLRAASREAGFDEIDSRCLHTRLTSFSFELLCTFPIVYLAALPIVRLLYWWEAARGAADGINLMVTFRKRDAGDTTRERTGPWPSDGS